MTREIELLGHLLQHPAWDGLMKPMILERVKAHYASLLVPSQRRKNDEPDDYLRGQIEALRWIVEYPEKIMDEAAIAELERESAVREAARQIPLFGERRPGPEGDLNNG